MEDAMKRLLIEVIAELSAHTLNFSHQGTTQIGTSPAVPTELGQEVARRRHSFERWGTDGAFQRQQAQLLLDRLRVTTRLLHGISTLLIPSDRDGPAVRLAIRILGLSHVPVRYLDADGIPPRLQERRCSSWGRSRRSAGARHELRRAALKYREEGRRLRGPHHRVGGSA
jgi:hypothetical protein